MIRAHVLICGGTGCTSSGSQTIQQAFADSIEANGLTDEIKIVQTGCFGLCALGPVVIVHPDGTFYSRVEAEDVPEIVSEHLLKGRVVERLVRLVEMIELFCYFKLLETCYLQLTATMQSLYLLPTGNLLL